MRRKTGWVLTASYLSFMGALGATAVWAEQMVAVAIPHEQSILLGSAGDQAPPFTLQNLDGETVTLASLRGERADQVVVLEWIDPECDWVKTLHRDTTMRDLYEGVHASGVQWAAIYSSRPPAGVDARHLLNKAAAEWGIEYPVLLDADGSTARLYHVNRTPEVVVISASGQIIYSGAVDDASTPDAAGSQNYLRSALRAALRGDSPESASTAAIGCNLDGTGAGGKQ